MSAKSLLLLVIAATVAVCTAMLVKGQLAGHASGPSQTRILVAAADIAPGSFIRIEKHLQWMLWPEDNLNPSFLLEGKADPATFNGAVARRQILKGEPVSDGLLVTSNEGGFMSAVLKPGLRAVSIPVDSTTGNAGFIFPGDRVDLIITHSVQVTNSGGESEDVLTSETFIENVRVLAADQQLDNPENAAIMAKTVTLEVSKRQAEKINVAKDLGKISLSLRSLATGQETAAEIPSGEPHFTRDSDVSTMLSPHTATGAKVQVIRGGEREQIEFKNYVQ